MWDARADAKAAAAPPGEVADHDRDAERLLTAQLDDDAPALLLDAQLLEHLLGALDRDQRLLAVDRLDVDVADRHLDLDLDRLGCVEAVLGHLRWRGRSWGGGCA